MFYKRLKFEFQTRLYTWTIISDFSHEMVIVEILDELRGVTDF